LDSMSDIKLDRKKIELTDGKVMMRPYRPSDAESLYQAVRESLAELSVWMPWAHREYSIKESRAWIKKKPGEWEKGVSYDFAIFDAADRLYLGGCGINNIDRTYKTANLGYWVRTGHTGRGVATAVTLLLARWAFEELKLNRIEIVVATDNQPSLRVAEKVGAKREGIQRNRLIVRDKPHEAMMHSLIPQDIAPV
jgi:ribosomal-protein-serine acetyltransferase